MLKYFLLLFAYSAHKYSHKITYQLFKLMSQIDLLKSLNEINTR